MSIVTLTLKIERDCTPASFLKNRSARLNGATDTLYCMAEYPPEFCHQSAEAIEFPNTLWPTHIAPVRCSSFSLSSLIEPFLVLASLKGRLLIEQGIF